MAATVVWFLVFINAFNLFLSAKTETEDNIHLFAWLRGQIIIGGISEQSKNSQKRLIFALSVK